MYIHIYIMYPLNLSTDHYKYGNILPIVPVVSQEGGSPNGLISALIFV